MRVIFVRDVELVRAAVRPLVRLCELAEVCDRYTLAMESDLNAAPVHRDLDVVPVAHRFHRVLRRFHQIVNGACVVVTGARRVIDRYFDAVETHVLSSERREGTRPYENAAVAALADF